MRFTDILGYAAGALTAFTFVPQVIKTWRDKHARDISLNMFILAFLNEIMWLVWGILIHNWIIIITNGVMLFLSGAMIVMKIKYNKEK